MEAINHSHCRLQNVTMVHVYICSICHSIRDGAIKGKLKGGRASMEKTKLSNVWRQY